MITSFVLPISSQASRETRTAVPKFQGIYRLLGIGVNRVELVKTRGWELPGETAADQLQLPQTRRDKLTQALIPFL